MSHPRPKMTLICVVHYIKLFYRSALLITGVLLYVCNRNATLGETWVGFQNNMWFLLVMGIAYVAEMILRFFPSKLESPGCQKIFKKGYEPTGKEYGKPNTRKSTLAVAAAWIALNGVIGVLYFCKILDSGILILVSLAYAVCDLICILFFCPFQTWFMKNKCCTTCRIYNWDFAMMCTPLVFIARPFSWTLVGLSLLLLIYWEITLRIHPERFSESTNAKLNCANCTEKLCRHKKQLRNFIKNRVKREK